VLLFSGYIVYDFNRAQFVTKTPGNAICVGVAIFLDVVNLFIRLLALFGQSDD
jgi:FtsH-binding integral membrane protein